MPLDYIISKEKALQQYTTAEHLLQVTFPLVKDKTLFLAIIHHLVSSLENAVEAMIFYDAYLHSLPSLLKKGVSFQQKMTIFREKVMKPYHISPVCDCLPL